MLKWMKNPRSVQTLTQGLHDIINKNKAQDD